MRKYHIHIILIVLTVIIYFMTNFQRVAIPGAIFDTLQNDLNLNAPMVTSLGAVFMYSYAVSLLFCGILVDKFGGIRVITKGSILFAIGAILFPNTTNVYILYLSRFLLGIGSATFYLAVIPEIKKCFPDKYFSIILSLVLLIGYAGGICANAPFIYFTKTFSWQSILNCLGFVTLIIAALILISRIQLGKIHPNEHVKFSLIPFKKVLSDRFNRYLFLYSGINYGLYYVIQTVIGGKFLNDFLNIPIFQTSILLSAMIVIAGVSGLIMATISSKINNKKMVFLKTICIMYTIIFGLISTLLILEIKTKLLLLLMLFVAIGGGMSSILIPSVVGYNQYDVRSTSLSIMNFCGFIMVGFFGNLVGFLLNLFAPISVSSGHIIYSTASYICVFITFFLFALVEVFASTKLRDI